MEQLILKLRSEIGIANLIVGFLLGMVGVFLFGETVSKWGELGPCLFIILTLVALAAGVQNYASEKALGPIKDYLMWLEPPSEYAINKQQIQRNFWRLFFVWVLIFAGSYIIIVTYTAVTVGVSFTLFYISMVIFSGVLIGRFYVLRSHAPETDLGEEELRNNARQALLTLAHKDALVAFVLPIIEGIIVIPSFHYFVKLTWVESFLIFMFFLGIAIISYPLQYFLFKRAVIKVVEELVERDKWSWEPVNRIGIYPKLAVSFIAIAFYVAMYLVIITYSSAGQVLALNSYDLLETSFSSTLSKQPDINDEKVISEAVKSFAVSMKSESWLTRQDGSVVHGTPVAKQPQGRAGVDIVVEHTLPNGMKAGIVYPWKNLSLGLGKYRSTMILFGMIGLIVAVATALLAAKDISEPIKAMRDAAAEVAQGNLDAASHVDSEDEIGELSAAFREMSFKLMQGLKHGKMLTENIDITVQHLSSSTSEMQVISKEQSTGATHQADATRKAAEASEQIAQNARDVAENIMTVQNVTSETESACQKSVSDIREAMLGITEARGKVDDIAISMVRLGEKSQTIGGIISIIEEIGEQTNLLAINASIEAQGAGEAGRRFSVIAKDVKRLAEGTADAANQIKALIGEIQNSVTKVIMQTEDGAKAVTAASDMVNQVSESFVDIETLVKVAYDATLDISSSTQQQRRSCEDLSEIIGQVHDVAQQVALSSKETGHSMDDLSELATKLKEIVMEG